MRKTCMCRCMCVLAHGDAWTGLCRLYSGSIIKLHSLHTRRLLLESCSVMDAGVSRSLSQLGRALNSSNSSLVYRAGMLPSMGTDMNHAPSGALVARDGIVFRKVLGNRERLLGNKLAFANIKHTNS